MSNTIELISTFFCGADLAFSQFIVNKELESWLCVKADVEPRKGGKYELFWSPETPEDNSTKGCIILQLTTNEFIQFNWKGPVQFRSFMNTREPLTNVSIRFDSLKKKTRIKFIHAGWGEGAKWEEARNWFQLSWSNAFRKLENKLNT